MKSIVNFCFKGCRSMKYGIIAVMLLGMTGIAFGQHNSVTAPAPDSREYVQHNDQLENDPGEDVDYVTEGSTMRYFVMPNAVANPDYNPSTPFVFTNVLSSFTWSWSSDGGNTALGTINPVSTPPVTSPFISVLFDNATPTFIAPVPGQLTVLEVPDGTQVNACTDADALTVMDIAVIPKPQIGFVANTVTPNAGEFYDFECLVTLPTSGFEITVPIDVTTANVISTNPSVEITYSVAIEGGATILTNEVYILPNNAQSALVIPVPDANIGYNKYVITITDITDRISRKSFVAVPGVIITAGGANVFTWEVMEPVKTGPIFRIPNNI
jgi:hypothetical protein